LYHGAISGGAEEKEVVIINDELEALQSAMDNARSGDLIIMFYEKFAPAFQLVQEYMEFVQPISILQDTPAFMPAVGSAIQ
jgi:cyanophycin synthetase